VSSLLPLKLSVDSDGRGRAEGAPPFDVLGWYLEDDIQGDPQRCDEVISMIDQVESGTLASWEEAGNAHTLYLAPSGAIIESEFADPPKSCALALTDLRDVVLHWRAIIEPRYRRIIG
jgi:hypothetical protein